jgi:LPXTG-site transpeptidase (sortase) family protein
MLKKLKALKWRLLPLVAAAIVLCIPFAENYWSRHQVSSAASSAQTKLDQSHKIIKLQGNPNRILIPSLSIDLPVVPQSYSTALKSWPVAPSSANYATETALINNTKGQSLIYGHDNRSVFGPLLTMPPGTVAYIYTDNGHIFKYSYVGYKDVSPQQINVVAEMAKAPAGLNLITCTGDYFQYRHLMTLKLIQAT